MTQEDQPSNSRPLHSAQNGHSNQVLVVHGYNPPIKKEVVSTLTQLGLDPILSQGKGNAFIPIEQKVEKYKSVYFVVVILYPDDFVYPWDGKPENALLNSSQKVVFELGFWIGKFGRNRVFVLYHENKKFRQPSGAFDALYVKFDNNNLWKKELTNHLSQCGFKLDK